MNIEKHLKKKFGESSGPLKIANISRTHSYSSCVVLSTHVRTTAPNKRGHSSRINSRVLSNRFIGMYISSKKLED